MMKTKRKCRPFGSKAWLFFPAMVLVSLVFWINPSSVTPSRNPKTPLVPSPLLKWPEKGSDYAVLVDKTEQKVWIYHRDDPYRPVKSYSASTGENDGPKSRQNDKKTPEGIYFFTNAYVGRELAPIYGPRAFPLDYPNPVDSMEGKKGYGLWFHGLNKPLKPKDTNGCIALENRDINELADFITLYDTPVVISSRIEKVDKDQLKKEAKAFEKLIEEWRSAWENKEIGRYMSLYHKHFTSGSKDWKRWRDYKARLNKKYGRIRVEIDNLRILKNDGLVLAEFTQRYSTGGFKSEGKKRIYLKQNSRQWKIIGEFFSEGQVREAVLKKPKIRPEDEIRKFLDGWKDAWESKDLKAYIACYDSAFRSREMDLRAWESHRERLNQKYSTLHIDIQGLKISEVSNGAAKVSFRQLYRADKYKDFGIKNILLIKRGNLWKIRAEEWRPMRGRPRT